MTKKTRSRGLTILQEKYAHAYVGNDGKRLEAAITAGYSPASARIAATKNMRDKKVIALIDKLKKGEMQKLSVDYDSKLKKLWKIVEISVPDAAQTLEDIDAMAGVKAIAELNKMQGHYSEDVNLPKANHVNIHLEKAEITLQLLIQKYEKEY